MDKHTALLLIDLQRDFLDESGRLPVNRESSAAVVSAANRLLKYAEDAGWMRIFIKNEFPASDWVGHFFRKHAAITGTAGAEIDPQVSCRPGFSVFTKSKPDAFTNPGLQRSLQAGGIKTLVILGVMAEGCVRATVKQAARLGYRVIVVTDGVASNRQWKKELGLWAMRRSGADFISSSEMIRIPNQRNPEP